MRKFQINVNGKSYEVEVEEIKDGIISAPPTTSIVDKTLASAPVVKASTPSTAAKAVSVSASAVSIKAPMPGTILAVNVTEGAEVKEGDVLCILEAMKMENEIMAPKSGKVTAIAVSKGSAVNNGDLLLAIE